MTKHDEMKSGNLYLYTMDPDIDYDGKYKEIYVLALSENISTHQLSNKYSKYEATKFFRQRDTRMSKYCEAIKKLF